MPALDLTPRVSRSFGAFVSVCDAPSALKASLPADPSALRRRASNRVEAVLTKPCTPLQKRDSRAAELRRLVTCGGQTDCLLQQFGLSSGSPECLAQPILPTCDHYRVPPSGKKPFCVCRFSEAHIPGAQSVLSNLWLHGTYKEVGFVVHVCIHHLFIGCLLCVRLGILKGAWPLGCKRRNTWCSELCPLPIGTSGHLFGICKFCVKSSFLFFIGDVPVSCL